MAFDPQDVMQVTWFGISQGQAINYVHHWRIPEAGTGTADKAFIDLFLQALETRWLTSLRHFAAADHKLIKLSLDRITGRTAPIGTPPRRRLVISEQAGKDQSILSDFVIAPGPSKPLATCVALNLRKPGDVVGRFSRGSTRLYGLDEEDVDGNAVNAAGVDRGEDNYALYMALITVPSTPPAQMEHCVFGRESFLKSLLAAPTPRSFSARVTTVTATPFVSTQNSRKQRRATAG